MSQTLVDNSYDFQPEERENFLKKETVSSVSRKIIDAAENRRQKLRNEVIIFFSIAAMLVATLFMLVSYMID